MKQPPEEGKIIPNHEYDGIQEFDYPLPNWWLATFYLTIIFGFFYFAYYAIGDGPTLNEEFAASMKKIEQRKFSNNQQAWPDESKLLEFSKSSGEIKEGNKIFATRCVVCHGNQGEGSIGPNLTDRYWIHGKGSLVDIAKLIKEGVNDKGMPAWGGLLKDEEIYEVTSYVKSLHNTQPPQPKAPQGNEIQE